MSEKDKVTNLQKGCLTSGSEKQAKRIGFNNLFETEWEVFVVKKDELTGQFIGKTACCALSKV